MLHTDIHLLARVALAGALAYAFGFERQLRGSPAGNRTFVHGATIRGLTSAATVFAVAGIGIVLGYGHLYLGLFIAAGFLFMLELQHIPGLRFLDASTYAARFTNDYEVPLRPEGAGGVGPGTLAPGTVAPGTAVRGAADHGAGSPPADPTAP